MFPSNLKSLGKLSDPNKFARGRWLRRVFSLLGLLVFFGAGFLFGSSYVQSKQSLNLSKFWEVYGLLQSEYLRDVNPTKAAVGATKGLVASLDDPYSSYLTKGEKEELDQDLSGKFQGIGAELAERNGKITVVSPLEGSPAKLAGLKSGDVIASINETTTAWMALIDAVVAIRGPEGTTVKLTVTRTGVVKPLELTITREKITMESVKSEIRNGVMTATVTQFGDDTVDLFSKAINDAKSQNVKAIIIDLRDNAGGYLNTVPKMAGLFLPPSTIVVERYRDGATEELHSTSVPTLPDTPLYLLVNKNSASAAEIFTGALQDYRRAVVIGEKTYGKGVVQEIIPLSGQAALRLTVAEWLTPKMRQINDKGLQPSVKVTDKRTNGADPIMKKALALIAELP